MEAKGFVESALARDAGFSGEELRRWKRMYRIVLLALLAAGLLILWIGSYTDLDLMLSDAVYDRQSATFPWRHAWLTEVVGHTLFKRAMLGLALMFNLLVAWDLLSARPWTNLRRFQMRLVALSAILVPTVVAALKQVSSSHCPWDLARYGGTAPYVRLLEAVPAGIGAGHCMPGGHASSALWLASVAVFFLPKRPGAAAVLFIVFLAPGFLAGWLQQLRGAHFFTHTLWSMWISCAVIFGLLAVLDRCGRR